MAKQSKAAKRKTTTKATAQNGKTFEEGVEYEQARILAFLKIFKAALGDNYYALHNRIIGGDDPRDPDYMNDRLMP